MNRSNQESIRQLQVNLHHPHLLTEWVHNRSNNYHFCKKEQLKLIVSLWTCLLESIYSWRLCIVFCARSTMRGRIISSMIYLALEWICCCGIVLSSKGMANAAITLTFGVCASSLVQEVQCEEGSLHAVSSSMIDLALEWICCCGIVLSSKAMANAAITLSVLEFVLHRWVWDVQWEEGSLHAVGTSMISFGLEWIRCCSFIHIIDCTCCRILDFNIRYCHCNLLINDQYSFESSIISHCWLLFCNIQCCLLPDYHLY